MLISERTPGDMKTLTSLVARERDARKRDRLRAVLLALRGKEAIEIAEMLGRSRRQAQVWVYAFRDGGPIHRKGDPSLALDLIRRRPLWPVSR